MKVLPSAICDLRHYRAVSVELALLPACEPAAPRKNMLCHKQQSQSQSLSLSLSLYPFLVLPLSFRFD